MLILYTMDTMPFKNKQELYAYQIQRWIRVKEKAVIYKGGRCTHCSGMFPYPAMQFHHRNPEEKDCSWTKLRLKSWDKITVELDKCDLICANCHAIHHSSFE